MGKPKNEIIFTNTAKKDFGYLESEYGFKISLERNSEARPQTDGVVEYTSNTIVIIIDSETGYAAVRFYRTKDGRKYELDPVAIHEYVSTSEKEKELLLSTNSKDQPAASALFNQKFLLNQPGWKTEADTTQDKLEIRLANYANWLKAHANLCLEGDFSQWPKFYEYKLYRARADHLRRGKDELVYARVKDAGGNYKLIKQSAFKDDLEHIEKLKKEFPG
jgi:hypothetical protein